MKSSYLLYVPLILALSLVKSSAYANSELNSCSPSDNPMERMEWWLQEHGPLVAGSLLATADLRGPQKMAQITLVKSELHANGALTRSKFLALELAYISELKGLVNEAPPLQQIEGYLLGQLELTSVDPQRVLNCAFECPSADFNDLGAEFRSCIEESTK